MKLKFVNWKKRTKKQKAVIISLALLALFIYNPPVCIGPSAGHLYVAGPFTMYSLHNLAAEGKLPLVAASLLVCPWRLNAKGHHGETPLHCAAANGHIWTSKFLVLVGADVNSATRSGSTPFGAAFNRLIQKHKVTDLAAFFISHGLEINPQPAGPAGPRNGEQTINSSTALMPPLSIAAGRPDREIARLLVEKGANLNPPGAEQTPLMAAVSSRDIELVNYLIKQGADVNFAAYDGKSPLMELMKDSSKSTRGMVKLLLEHGADVNAQDVKKRTALHYFYFSKPNCNRKDLLLLIQYGANLNAQDEKGETILHQAIRCCQDECVEVALENGADLAMINDQGLTPADEFKKKLEEKDRPRDSPCLVKISEILARSGTRKD